jgi:protein-L-isoaspartate(D-aspartate) O-methyltransferase
MSATEAEERAQFTLAMRARGINDIELLRALERVPRALFMPQRFADMAGRDIALPIGCGQSSPPPSVLAAMIAALGVRPSDRVCEIGTGTGYCTALLAQLAGEVVTLERFQTLAVEAAARLEAFGVSNVKGLWRDGFDFHEMGERFDRVIVHGLVEPPALTFVKLIAVEGAVTGVAAGPGGGADQRVIRLTVPAEGPVAVSEHGPARALRRLELGLARAL